MTEEFKEKKTEIVEEIFDLGFEKVATEGGYDEVYFVKAKTKDAAHFEFSKKVGDKMFVDPSTTHKILSGKLTKVEQGNYTYENKEIKTISMNITAELGGKNVLFMLNMSYTQVGRSIINSLLGTNKPIKKIYMELYSNRAGFASMKVLFNDNKAVWKYSIEDQRKKIETITNKAGAFVSNDYMELDTFLESELRTHLGILFPELDTVKFVEKSEKVSDEDSEEAADFFEIDA